MNAKRQGRCINSASPPPAPPPDAVIDHSQHQQRPSSNTLPMRRPNEEEEEEGGGAEGKGDSAPLLLPDVHLPSLASEGRVRPRRLPLPSTSLVIDSSTVDSLRRTSLSPASSRYSFLQVSRGE